MKKLTGLSLLLGWVASAGADTTITTTNHFAYGANLGWVEARGDGTSGAVIGEYVCSGYIYAANVGWISLGSGAPTNQIQYQNSSAGDFGVNHDGQGNLRGYAYGANIGWVNFETTGAPRVDLATGNLSGYAWSANCGWISLSNSAAFVQTGSIRQGLLAPNGLPIAWLLQNFGTTNVNANADADNDGASNASEYLAGTNPNDPTSVLRLTRITRGTPTPAYTTLLWTSVPTRFYVLEYRTGLDAGSWQEWVTFPWAGANNAGFSDRSAQRFYRIRAFRPLGP